MQKFLNEPENFVVEMLEGILLAHPKYLRSLEDVHCLVRTDAPLKGKVGIVTGGGSGHLPLFLGYVGSGLLTGVAVGDVFASPTAEQILNVTREANSGAGVLFLYGNYGGDVMNFDLAGELAEMEGIATATVVGADDIASAEKGDEGNRRGIAGIVLLYKVAGAKAEEGASLEEVVKTVEFAASRVRTFGVALSSMTLPAVGKPTFDLDLGQMEIGMGIHGEQGIHRGKLENADQVAETLLSGILKDMPISNGSRVALIVNGLGATPLEELYVLYRHIHKRIEDLGIHIHKKWIGEYVTSLEMAGASLSIMVLDDQLIKLIDAPATTPFFVQQ
jgi:dihydroxyacetone kinase-like protein